MADELIQAAARLGTGPEVLQSLLKDGFIDELADGDPVASAPAPTSPTASISDGDRAKLYAAKAAMRRYIKIAAVETLALSSLVDGVHTPDELASALRKMKRVFDDKGFARPSPTCRASCRRASAQPPDRSSKPS
jgi:hypothetical protein